MLAACLAAGLVLALGTTAFGGPGSGGSGAVELRAAGDGSVQATIRRDSKGIPHILADDFAGLGFGYGYAFAEDNLCTMAETYVTVRGERSRYFGPDGDYQQRGNGFSANNLNSDFFYQHIIDRGVIEEMIAQPPPAGPKPEVIQGVKGYVAGYNRYLADTGVANLPDARCRGAAWVKPISEIDAYRRFYQLALLASSTVAIDGIGNAKTPGASGLPIDPGDIADGLAQELPIRGIGSNAYGLGAEATTNGKGIVLANPHFPWDGTERFYQSHLTIPGEVNVSGGSLFGVPLVLIGHTDKLAWSHTVSTAYRFTPFQETVNPLDPTQYLYDGGFRDMDADEVTVTVKTDDGLEERTRTLYSTHHGPIVDNLVGVPLPWTPATAFSLGDANATNFRYLNHFFDVNKAQSVRELDDIERTYQGIPWVNTIAADSAGEAYYADIGTVPNVSDQKAMTCNSPVGVATYAALRLPVLNGLSSACEWDDDPDAAAPGIFGYDNMPKLFRDDYVTNSNDSYWLSNPEEPLEGYAPIIGDEGAPRTLRTRLGLKMIIERFGDPGAPATQPLNRQDVQDIVFNDRQMAGELWRDELVALCESAPGGFLTGTSGPVNVAPACPVLENWDLHENLDSNGAILFRRFAGRALANPGGLPVGLPLPVGDISVYSTPFSAADPVDTPSGLQTGSPKVQAALADAVTDLNGAGIPLDAPLLGYQYEKRGDEKIPIHGGPGDPEGSFNAINVSWVPDGPEPGYPNVAHGSSFVMVTQFDDSACGMDDRSILTYSQSDNPSSPHFADQTRMFSQKQWVNPASCEAELAVEPGVTSQTISGCLPGASCPAAAPPTRCSNPLRGTRRPDKLRGTPGPDLIRGKNGADRILGRGGDDCLRAGAGDDRIAGGGGSDQIVGGRGDDVIRSRDGARDVVRCGPGKDRVRSADRTDKLKGCESRPKR